MNDPTNTKKALSESVHEAAEAIAAAGSAAASLERAAVQAIEGELQRRPRWRVALSALGWTLVTAYFLFAGIVLGLRYWVLPNIGQYTGLIEQKVSAVIGERVTIGEVGAGWDGLRPELDLRDLRVHDRDGGLVLQLPAVEAVFSWSSLLVNSVRFHSLALDRPDLAIRRDAQGAFHVAGLKLAKAVPGEPGFADWLLKQSEVSVRGAGLTWTDEWRGAPPLELSGVELVLRNSGSSHRFALRASVPRNLASTLDVRGELNGRDPEHSETWSGKLFAELDYIDLAAWRQWIDYPLELRAGEGGLRVWAGFAANRITEVTADVALGHVQARTAPELPFLELDYLSGRLGGKQTQVRNQWHTEVSGARLTLRSRGGVALPPAQFALKLDDAPGAADGSVTRKGEFTADTLDLEPIARLSGFLPLPAPLRQWLEASQPRGHVRDLKLTWQGAPDRVDEYSLKTRFAALALRAHGQVPGFAGFDGTLAATHKDGSVTLQAGRAPALLRARDERPRSEPAQIDLGSVMGGLPLQFDSFSAETSWTLAPDKAEFRFRDVNFANADAAGTVSGSFATRAGSPGVIDLTGSLNRAEARAVWRYIPFIDASLRDYLKAAIVAGQSRDVKLRLKGDLNQFPFADARQGQFSVTARIADGELNYIDGWPHIGTIAADFAIEGRQLSVRGQRGTVAGTRLAAVRATIPDLFHADPQLNVEGQVEGALPEFLRFIEVSPVGRMIDNVTRDMRGSGNGRLQLRLDVPLVKPENARVAGNFTFQNSQVAFDPDLPPLTQANGRLDFTEAGMQIKGVTGQYLGGPVTVNAQTRDGGVSIAAQGSATMAAVRRLVSVPGLEHASGAAAWRGNINVRRGVLDLVIESPLQGVAIDLPAPLGKAAQEMLPLRVERSNGADAETVKRFRGLRAPARGDLIAVTLGTTIGTTGGAAGAGPTRSLNVLAARRPDGRGYALERAAVGVNEAAPVPAAAGIAVSGNFNYLDMDRWQPVLTATFGSPAGAPGTGAATTAPAAPAAELGAVNFKVATLDAAGRRLHDVNLRAQPRGGQWNAILDSREIKGDVRWRPEGRGLIQARLAQLVVPGERPPVPGVAATANATAADISRELPALDVVADSFTLKDRQLGKLELVAVNESRDWRIEKLVLSNPESSLKADGIWQSWAARPSISLNVALETSDLGKFLDRLGYPKIMANGSSRLEGRIGWAGNPATPDFPTLTGNLKLSAERGQFLKADPGVAKLLGVLSLQSLVTLDFRDLFREGFSYDTITGTATVNKGVVATSDFYMKGSSAQVRMSGSIDLARETQALHLRVIPSLGDGASTVTTAILANPILGIGLTLLQRLLKDPLGQAFAVEYDVTGGWDDPKVTRTRVDAPQSRPE